jgi:phosphate transport system ATP-binding protein
MELIAVPLIIEQPKSKVMNGSNSLNPHIVVENLNIYIQENHILKNINMTIPDKSITCIIGPSGCGKTTLLRSFNRLHDDNMNVKITGKLFVDGEDIYAKGTEVTHIRKKMGLLA